MYSQKLHWWVEIDSKSLIGKDGYKALDLISTSSKTHPNGFLCSYCERKKKSMMIKQIAYDFGSDFLYILIETITKILKEVSYVKVITVITGKKGSTH